MITPTSGSIVTESGIYDGIWLQSIQIISSTPSSTIVAKIRATPFNSISGTLAPGSFTKVFLIDDVISQSMEIPSVGIAMNSIFVAMQNLIVSKSIF